MLLLYNNAATAAAAYVARYHIYHAYMYHILEPLLKIRMSPSKSMYLCYPTNTNVYQ